MTALIFLTCPLILALNRIDQTLVWLRGGRR